MLVNTRVVRIEWGDCDPAGIVYYPRYFAFFDASTAALIERALGMSKSEYLKAYDFAGHPLVRTRSRFLVPTRFGDDVTIETSVAAIRRASFDVLAALGFALTPINVCANTYLIYAAVFLPQAGLSLRAIIVTIVAGMALYAVWLLALGVPMQYAVLTACISLILAVAIPPLLYAASLQTSLIDFNANRRPILLLSVWLVVVTTVGVALVVHLLVPSVGWSAAFAIGAVVAPPDAIAATAIGRRVGMPRRVVTILEGESLLNDATALVALRTAIGAGALIAFFQSVENFNITLFTRGNSDTLTVYVGSKIRSGITPTINALALALIALTIVGAVAYEVSRRRAERREQEEAAAAAQAEDADLAILPAARPLPSGA